MEAGAQHVAGRAEQFRVDAFDEVTVPTQTRSDHVIDDDAWAGPSGVPDLTLGEGVLTLWYDTYVHADDIRVALGQESERGDGLDATIAYLAKQLTAKNWGPATLALDPDVNIY